MAPTTLRKLKANIPRMDKKNKQKTTRKSSKPKSLTQFHPFAQLVPELREHILSFFPKSSLFNYAQCASLCHQEIQRFNTIAPGSIKLANSHEFRGTEVTFTYDRGSRVFKSVCEPQTKLENGIEEATQLVEKHLKYVRAIGNCSLFLCVKRWPTDLMELNLIDQVTQATSNVHRSTYKAFSQFLNNSQVSILMVNPVTEKSAPAISNFILPNSFFKSDSFKRLKITYIWMESKIEEQDFLRSEAAVLHVQSSTIGEDAMNKKIRQWYNGERPAVVDYQIMSKKKRTFDEEVVMSGMRFIDGLSTRRGRKFIVRPDGGVAFLEFTNRYVHFGTHHFLETWKLWYRTSPYG